jgi:hypothetical protein
MWTTTAHGGPDDEWARRSSAPENEAPATVPVSVVLARTATAAVTLTGVQVFTTGIAFTVGLRCRPETLAALESRDLGDLLWGHRGPGPQLLVGVELADGRRASNVPAGPDASGDPGGPDAVLFHGGGGSAGQLSADHSWWLSPLPPAGPLRVVVRCDPLGVPDTVTELDGAAIRAAAERVVTLWPWVSPHEVDVPMTSPAPDLPAGSWFAGA